MKKSKLLITTLASIIAMNTLTACNSGGYGYSNNEVMQTKVKAEDKVNSAKYNEVASLVAKSITSKILISGSALQTRIEEQSTMKESNFNDLYNEIYKVYKFNKNDASFRGKLHKLVDESAEKFDIEKGSIAYNNLVAFAHNEVYTLNAFDGVSEIDALINLIDFSTGVCDNLTAYAFSLFKQHKEFKDAKMIPARIGHHVFLLIKFNDLDIPYVFDAWLPYLDVDAFHNADSNKVFFGPVDKYVNQLKFGKKNDYLDPEEMNVEVVKDDLIKFINGSNGDKVKTLWSAKHILNINEDTEEIAARFEPVK